MPLYLGALTLICLIGLVVTRVLLLRRKGIEVMHFGKIDKTDFLIPPFALLYFYLIFAYPFALPGVGQLTFVQSEIIAWLGVGFCLAGLVLFLWSLRSLGESFRVGIDTETPDRLITTGAFALSRSPIYVAFVLVLAGEFIIFVNWILLVYFVAAGWLIHRQVLREEAYLQQNIARLMRSTTGESGGIYEHPSCFAAWADHTSPAL